MESAEMAVVCYLMENSIGLRHQRDLQDAKDFVNLIFANSPSFSSDSEGTDIGPEEHPKCNNFVDVIDAYSGDDFKSHMRLQRSTVSYLIDRYSQHETYIQRSKIGCKKTVYVYIWYKSNSITYRQLSISHEFIKWPQGPKAEETQRKFGTKNYTGRHWCNRLHAYLN